MVIGRVHEHLVDAAGLGLDEHRAEVVHGEEVVAVEGRVAVRHDAHRPGAVGLGGLDRGWGLFLVARAEGARSVGVELDRVVARDEVVGASLTVRHDRHPPPVEWIQAHLAHRWSGYGGRATRG